MRADKKRRSGHNIPLLLQGACKYNKQITTQTSSAVFFRSVALLLLLLLLFDVAALHVAAVVTVNSRSISSKSSLVTSLL